MEDFHFREKMTHFDHERIPEQIFMRVGFGEHGIFQLYQSLEDYLKAGCLTRSAQNNTRILYVFRPYRVQRIQRHSERRARISH